MISYNFQVDVIVPSETGYLGMVGNIGECIGRELDKACSKQQWFAYHLDLVLTEATSNAIKHCCREVTDDTVRVTVQTQDSELVIRVYDHGQGFCLDTIPQPIVEQLPESGLGLFFIQSLMDSVTYTQSDDYNVLEIKKSLIITDPH